MKSLPLASVLLLSATALYAQTLDTTKADAAVRQVMDATRVPSAQVGIAQQGKTTYLKAFGDATLGANGMKKVPATTAMHYAVGSISKQFTATCVLLLVEQGKMTLDDPVSKWFPELTRANEVTVRNLLTHTSGYSDYAPQDYTIPEWTKVGDPLETVRKWAGKPLDFDPGTKWQYSNTNFVLAGLIVQKVSGEPFHQFLQRNVIEPLHLKDVIDLNWDRAKMEPTGYMQFAMGPLRPAIPEAKGWYFADGQLAMPVATLLEWDESMMHRTLLKTASYDAMFTSYKLKDGSDPHYGLGVQVDVRDGHRVIAHSGEIGGFVAMNAFYPDDDVAIAVLTNQEASSAAGEIAAALRQQLIPMRLSAGTKTTEIVRSMLLSLAKGEVDRALCTEDLNFYFSAQALEDFKASLAPLGKLTEVKETRTALRGGMTMRSYAAKYGEKEVIVSTYWTKAADGDAKGDGKLEQFIVEAAD